MSAKVQARFLKKDRTLQEIVRRIAAAYHPLRIYLFGSKARGTAGPDSDYDLLVVVPDDAPAELKEGTLAYQRLWGIRKSKDVLVCTDEWFRSRSTVVTSLPATVKREGKLLYAA
ncbi:MAG: nucleotidyltransferase domain-containing protein [Candidatus Binataceae bacterium]